MPDEIQTPETPEGDDTPPGANNDGNGTGTEQERTFSQADVDRIAGDARQQARNKATGDLLQELGLKDLDGLKTLVKTAKERADAERSETERLQARVTELETAAADLQTANESLEALNNAVSERVTTLIKDLKIPKYVTTILETMTPLEQLNYINANSKEFSRPAAPNINGGDGNNQQPQKKDPAEREKQLTRRFPSLGRAQR